MEPFAGRLRDRSDGHLLQDVVERLPGGDAIHQRPVLAAIDHLDEERADLLDVDHPELAVGRGQHRGVAELGRKLGPLVCLLRRVEVHLGRRRGEPLADPGVEERLAELDARGQLGHRVAALHGQLTDPGRELGRAILLLRYGARPSGGA